MSARGGGRGRGASDGFEFFRDRHEGGGRGARARGRGGRGRGRGRGGGNNSGGPSYADNGGGLEGPYRARGRGGRGGKRGRGGGRANDEEFGGTAYKQRRGEGNKGGSNKAPNPNQKTKLLPQYKPYKNHFQKYLDIEKEEEEAEINERLVSWPVHRLQHEGYAILGCTAKKHGKFFGKKVVRVFGPNGYMPFHKFSDGDILTLSTNFKITSLKQVDLEGVVMLKTGKYIQIVMDDAPKQRDIRDQVWRIDKGTNQVAYERMSKALQMLAAELYNGPAWLRDLITKQHKTWDSKIANETNDDGMAASSHPSHLVFDSEAGPSSELVCASQVTDTSSLSHLNETQRNAVTKSLQSSLSLIQGPPGTGKTTTAVQIIKQWRRVRPHSGPVLVSAQTNVAVDQLLSGLVGVGLNAVRVGQPVKVPPELRERTLESQMQSHPDYEEMEQLKEEMYYISQNMGSFTGRDKGMAHANLSKGFRRIKELEEKISQEIVGAADVICATCIGAGSDLLANNSFNLVVLDEATQCTEPESLVPLMRCKPEGQVILLGDHQQLPPTVLSPLAQNELSITIFERLIRLFREGSANVDLKNMFSTMLDIQYRMHPIIAEWPSNIFYDGRIRTGIKLNTRFPPSGFPWPTLPNSVLENLEVTDNRLTKSALCFVDVKSGFDESRGKSKANESEVHIVASIVQSLLYYDPTSEDKVSLRELGIITPYQGQVRALETMIWEMGVKIKSHTDEDLEDGTTGDGIEIKSVDGFQGREKDVIIFSAVRSNEGGNVGFLSDFRRLNVAMTRARRGFIVVGSSATLRSDPYWCSWIEYVRNLGLIYDSSQLFNSPTQ